MTTYLMTDPHSEHNGGGGGQASGFDRTARWIGDLDHPFYSDERNRFVWYEASAIGFQLMFMGAYTVAGLMLWIGGASAVPYALAMLAPAVITAVVLKGYVTRAGADYWPSGADFRRSRGIAALATIVVLISGAARAAFDNDTLTGDSAGSSFSRGFSEGMVPGLVAGAVAAVALGIWKNRSVARREAELELTEE